MPPLTGFFRRSVALHPSLIAPSLHLFDNARIQDDFQHFVGNQLVPLIIQVNPVGGQNPLFQVVRIVFQFIFVEYFPEIT